MSRDNRADRPKTCFASLGFQSKHLVYVTPDCFHVSYVKGDAVCLPEDCNTCLHYRPMDNQMQRNEDIVARRKRKYAEGIVEKDKDCKGCYYSMKHSGNLECDYIGMTGRIRPSAPNECKELGIWKSEEED